MSTARLRAPWRNRVPLVRVALVVCLALAVPATVRGVGPRLTPRDGYTPDSSTAKGNPVLVTALEAPLAREAPEPEEGRRAQRPQGAEQRQSEDPEPQEPPLGRRLATLAQVLATPEAGAGVGRPGTRPELWGPGSAGVLHRDLFPGIDLVYLKENTRAEVALLARPGAALSAIRLGFPDVESLRLEDGALVLTTGMLETRLERPTFTGFVGDERAEVPGGWLRRDETGIGVWTEEGARVGTLAGAQEGARAGATVLVHFEASFLEPETVGPEPAVVDLGGSAALVDTLVGDADTDGQVDPGDTIRYETTVDNSGDEAAEDTRLDATLDANTALVAGSLNISPLAVNDAYTDAIGNVTFTVDAASGVFANDRDPPDPGPCGAPTCALVGSPPLTVTTVEGGTVTLNADGSFEYVPPSGHSGDDSFVYEIEDDHATTPLTDTGTVTITVSEPIWFVDNTATPPGTGTQAAPFATLAAAEAAAGPGDIVWVREGDGTTTGYDAGITLQDGQRLVGQGVDLVVDPGSGPQTIETATNAPRITNPTGDVVTLVADTTVEGVELEPVASAGIYGTGALGTTTVDTATVDISGAGSDGIFLENATGSFTFQDGTVSTTTAGAGIGVRVDGGSPAVAVTNSAVSKTGGRALDVLNTTGGSVTFTGGSLTSTNGTGLRVVDAAGNVTVDGSTALTITGATGTPITVAGTNPGDTTAAVSIGGGTVTTNDGAYPLISGTNSTGAFTLSNATLTHSGGRIVDFDDMDGGGDFSGTTVTNSDHPGVRIVDSAGTFSNFFDVVTTTTADDAIVLQNNTSTVSFGLVDVTTSGNGNSGIFASSAGTVNVTDGASQIASTGGPAVDLDGTAVGMTFASVSSSGSGTAGIELDGVTGSFTATGGTVTGAAGVGVDINGGTGTVTYGGSITNASGGTRTIEITGRGAGTVTLSGAVDEDGMGILVQNNTGATVDLAGNLDVDTGANSGLTVTGGGTITVTGAANTIDTTTATAVDMADVTIGAAGVTLRSVVSTTASSNTVISLVNTGTGAFEVTGAGTSGSGGTISDKTADAVRLDNTDGPVTLRHMIIEDIGNMGVVDSEHDAIHGQSVDGGLVLDGVTIRRISDMAIHGAALPAGDADTVWNGLTITGSTFEDANRYHVAGEGDTSDEGTVRIRGLRGTVVVDGNVFQDGGEHLDLFATAGTLDLTVTANDFFETYKEFTSGAIASVGKMCLDVTVQGAANATVVVGDAADAGLANDFRNCRIASVRIANDVGATGTVTSTVAGNAFLVTDHSSGVGGDFDFPMGGVKYSTRGAASAAFDGRITGNSFTDVTNADGGVGNVTLDMDQGVIQVLVDGNTFHAPGNAAWFVRADATSSFALEFDTNTYERDAFPCTTDPSCGGGYFGPGLFNRVQVQNGGVIDVTLTNEALAQHDVGFDPGNTVEVQVLNVGGGGTACASFTGNSSPHGYALEESAGALNLAREASPIAVPAQCSGGAPGNCVTVLDDNSNTGGGGNPAADPPTVSVFGTIDIVSSACSLPSGTIF